MDDFVVVDWDLGHIPGSPQGLFLFIQGSLLVVLRGPPYGVLGTGRLHA